MSIGRLAIVVVACVPALSRAQAWVPPSDPLVAAKLEAWQDMKFGLLLHWGTYSQWGVVESWSICSEPWISRGGADYEEYKRDYEALATTFNPTRFDPELWAAAAADAGIRYMVFTTKHHDGFNMFATRQSHYGIAGPSSPFRDDPRANVTKVLFDAFRARGLSVGTYFSKPDWHSRDFWAPEWATPDRNVNYDVRRFPDRWQRFRDFTFRQIEELMTGYGPVDILWLDGGWVRPDSTINEEVLSWGYRIPEWEQDIDMPRIAAMARRHQPGILIVDRTVHGPYEDYRTPEQRVPVAAITDYPWESNMSMSGSWAYERNPDYKPVRTLVHTLVDVVAKGGNYLVGIGPGPDGTWDGTAHDRLREIGDWLRVNGEAIYATRPIAPYVEGKLRFTRSRETGAVYAIYLADEGETAPPAVLQLDRIVPAPGARVTLVETGATLEWEAVGTGAVVRIPRRVASRVASDFAWTIRIDRVVE